MARAGGEGEAVLGEVVDEVLGGPQFQLAAVAAAGGDVADGEAAAEFLRRGGGEALAQRGGDCGIGVARRGVARASDAGRRFSTPLQVHSRIGAVDGFVDHREVRKDAGGGGMFQKRPMQRAGIGDEQIGDGAVVQPQPGPDRRRENSPPRRCRVPLPAGGVTASPSSGRLASRARMMRMLSLISASRMRMRAATSPSVSTGTMRLNCS